MPLSRFLMNHAYKDRKLYMHCGKHGKKLSLIRKDPNVCTYGMLHRFSSRAVQAAVSMSKKEGNPAFMLQKPPLLFSTHR